jgi:dolichol-phosphate mannosyltransferase
MKKTLIILPVYNEAQNLPDIVKMIQQTGLGADILIIDDNSFDGTGRIADELAARDKKVNVVH